MSSTAFIDQQVIAHLTGQPTVRLAESPAAQAVGLLLIRDGLTELNNRGYFEQRFAILTKSASLISLVAIDLNGFKQVNDTLGHAEGDRLLIKTAEIVSKLLPAGGFAARFGGDEFAVALPGWSGAEAEGWATSLLQGLKQVELARTLPTGEAFLSASMGVAVWPDETDDLSYLLEVADRAMYQAKKQKGGSVFLNRAMQIGQQTLQNGWTIPLVGRDREWTQLLQAVSGEGHTFCLTGPTGIGKSRLAKETADLAATARWVVLPIQGGDGAPMGSAAKLLQAMLAEPRSHPLFAKN